MAAPAQVLSVVAAAGELLLRSGAEVARVEDTVGRIARAYGYADVEIFATPTGLFITLGDERHTTAMRRIAGRTFALDRVSAVNALSRELAERPLPPADALRRIEAIGAQPPPLPAWATPAASAIGAAACAMLAGGSLSDFGPAVLANAAVQGVQKVLGGLKLPDAIADFAAGFASVLCALTATRLLGAAFGPVVAGGIMVLLPGIAFTTAVRDAMLGDLTSAAARSLEAVMKAAALASGVAAALYATGRS
ncbi:MAG TPA: threonine/serine exporter family protein [Symbiobacteriaceae bacterium]|nr:threonine/serine exporter family protein [Symbiobacteriaceae bacterium]